MTAPLAHDADTFWNLYRASTCAVERRRAQFFALLAEGRPVPEILQVTRYNRVTVYGLVKRYREQGLAGLRDARHANQGAPRLLTAERQQTLAARLHADFEQGVVWCGNKSFHRRENSDQHEGPGGRSLKFPGLMGLYAK
nr:helix-turn-helix domain-containing protein [Deinococcus sp. LM3]